MPPPSPNIVRRGEPSPSALMVARQRAVHALLDEPIVLEDPVALPILGAPAEAALREDPFPLNDPFSRGLRAALVARARFAEDELARAVQAGVRQYVVLGAGLDTFAYRNPHPDLQVFEVDHPATQGWKRERLAEAGIALPPGLHFAAADFEHGTPAAALAEAGFRAGEPACVSWLGVTMYLSRDSVMQTLAWAASLPRGSSICFDHRLPVEMLNPVERVISDFVGLQIAAQGEPWISAFAPQALREDLVRLGFREVEDAGGDALTARFLPRRKDGLRVPAGTRLVCARR